MATTKVSLHKASILIVDEDIMISEVLKQVLNSMGLKNVSRARTASEALGLVAKQETDILITEWTLKPMDGLSLVQSIRKMELPRLALLPVIMLTARAEKIDVVAARDAGVTEFLVKPFTAKTLFNRLEHIIDFPRDFIVAEQFVGPDRRRNKKPSKKDSENRKTLPAIAADPKKINHVGENQRPYKIIPDHALKKKMGLTGSLDSIITLEILEQAQAQIASFQEESLNWISQDILKLELAAQNIRDTNEHDSVEIAMEALLSIKSRAGTFDYMLASEVALAMYRFMRNHFTFDSEHHLLVMQKHIDVLKIMLARQVKGVGGELEKQLMDGLSLLTQKFMDSAVAS